MQEIKQLSIRKVSIYIYIYINIYINIYIFLYIYGVAALSRLGARISTIPMMPPADFRFVVDIVGHVPFQNSIALEVDRNAVNSDVVSLLVRIIIFFYSIKDTSDSVRQVFWPVVINILKKNECTQTPYVEYCKQKALLKTIKNWF
jgi:hypothetical protein